MAERAREEASVERGGLGRDPAVAPVGAAVDFGDRAGIGDFAEHGESGVVLGWPAEVSASASGSVADAAEPRIRELLAACPRMPATMIAERIGWSYSIRTLSAWVRELRPLYLPPDPASRTTYVAGEIAQCDFWFPDVVVPVGHGQVRTATQLPVLTMVCGYSRWAFAVLIPTLAAEDLYAGWWQHLSTLGASPRVLARDSACPNPYTSHWRPAPHNRIHASFKAATSLHWAGPRSRPFVLAMLRAVRLDRRPSPSAAPTNAENDETQHHEPPLTEPRPFRDDNSSRREHPPMVIPSPTLRRAVRY